MTETKTLTPQQQIERSKALLQTAKNPKQIRQYKALIRGLQAQIKPVEAVTQVAVSEPVTPVEVTPVDGGEVVQQQQPETTQKKRKSKSKSKQKSQTEILFSAIGVIKGKIITTVVQDRQYYNIEIENKLYQLYFYINLSTFQEEIENSDNFNKYLLVYPRITHFYNKKKPHIVGFQVISWKDQPYEKYNPNEFSLRGFWQFNPTCKTPVVTVQKNKTPERIAWLENDKVENTKKLKFLQASHIPLIWKDAPIEPFQYNPKVEKDKQDERYFVQVRTKFLPEQNCWEFIETIEPPCKNYPKFLKLRKKDKQEFLAAKSMANQSAQTSAGCFGDESHSL